MNNENNSDSKKVPFKVKWGWGTAGLAECFLSYGLTTLVMPIFNIGFGVPAVWIGWAMAIPRIVDALIDPWIGNTSDNFRGRWGRRKPFVLIGGTMASLLFCLLWIPLLPGTNGAMIHFAVVFFFFSIAFSFFTIPWNAWGCEFTSNYDEKTSVLSSRFYISIIAGVSIQWLYKLCLLPVFGGTQVEGIRWVGPMIGLICVVAILFPVFLCPDRGEEMVQEKISLKDAVRVTLKNRPFLILMAGNLLILIAMWSCSGLGLYLNIYHVCRGDQQAASTLSGLVGTCMVGAAFLGMMMATKISTLFGKREAMFVGLGLSFLGTVSMWWTFTPDNHYLQIISFVFIGLGLQGCWLMVSSMTADACDWDRWKTGLRREGIYGAVAAFIYKVALALTAVSSGYVLKISGYVEKVEPSIEVITKMKMLLVGGQAAGILVAMLCFCFYSLNRKKMEEIQRELQ